jgi:GNAT superfamily N-acetyltransferase
LKKISVIRNSKLTDEEINALFLASWPGHQNREFQKVLEKSLVYVTAHFQGAVVGFVNVAWDGGLHGFVLDTTVHPDHQRSGLGSALLREAAAAAREAGLEWLHVDYEPALEGFYKKSGFSESKAALMHLK